MLTRRGGRGPRPRQPGESCLPPMRTAAGREAAAAVDRLANAIDGILDKCAAESGDEVTPLMEDTTSVALVAPLTLALLCLKLQTSIAEPPAEVKAMCKRLETALHTEPQVPTQHAVRMVFHLVAIQSDTIAHKIDLGDSVGGARPH